MTIDEVRKELDRLAGENLQAFGKSGEYSASILYWSAYKAFDQASQLVFKAQRDALMPQPTTAGPAREGQ